MSEYFDLRSGERRSLEGTLVQIFGVACHRLNISLNMGYNYQKESMSDVAKEISKKNSREAQDDFFEDYNRIVSASKNDRQSEDDVMIYLIKRSVQLISAPQRDRAYCYGGATEDEISRHLAKACHSHNKTALYVTLGDFLLFSMATGAITKTQDCKHRASFSYWQAHNIEEEKCGRGSALSEVYAKLSLRFQRYYALTEEVFQDAFFQAHLKPESLELPKLYAVDALLDELLNLPLEKKEERARIYAQLKKLTR